MIARARRSRSWRSGSATEVWCRTCSCFIGLLPLFILREESANGATNLSARLSLQLLPLCLDSHVTRVMSFDCHIESFFKLLKSAGQHVEQCQQEPAEAIAKRLLVA